MQPRPLPATSTTVPSTPSCPSVASSSQTPPREARPYGELQVHTKTIFRGLDRYLETVIIPQAVYLSWKVYLYPDGCQLTQPPQEGVIEIYQS